jgi:hypothetical protein
MKKVLLTTLVLVTSFLFSACTSQNTPVSEISPSQQLNQPETLGSCTPQDVVIEGYGDKGQMLSNCFVQYPGEPSRQDDSYYVVEDICGQFTPEFISAALGMDIVQTKPPEIDTLYNCSYYINDNEYLILNLEYLPIENQKKGHELMDRTTSQDSKIPMNNLVVYQADGQVNSIYLVLSDNKFISINRSSGSNLSSEKLVSFAANIGKEIKNYK